MFADVLVPNRHRAISNHHADLNTMLKHQMDHVMQSTYSITTI